MQRTSSSFAWPPEKPAWHTYSFALVMLLLAQTGRWLLDPHAGDAMPLSTMYVAVAFTVYFRGWKPAAVLAIAGYFIGLWLFISPRFIFKLGSEPGVLRTAMYAGTCAIIIFLCEIVRRARKKHAGSERKVVSILENMHECFCSVDREWRLTFVNRSAEACLGHSQEALIGRMLWDVLPHTAGTPAETQLRQAMGKGTPAQFETNAFVPAAWHAVTATRSDSELSIFFEDITANRAHLDQLERLVDDRTAALQRIVAELETFSYTLVHDMRAPLRCISGYAELLALDHAQQLNVEGRHHLTRIQQSAARMDQLIVDILDYSQLSRQQPELRAIHLDQTVHDILQSHPDFHPDKADILLETALPVVVGNDALLTQCFSNLLHNATKFVAENVKPRIRISGRTEGDVARIEIADNGIGISPDAVVRIFEPFRREHAHYEGTGIGLAIVQKVVDQLGGRVGVNSEPAQGSRFWVELKSAGKTSTSPATTNRGSARALV
ncbi:MAG: ATP-binding protein [Opitutaceae bacterium]